MQTSTVRIMPDNAHEYMRASITKRGVIWLDKICTVFYLKEFLYVRATCFEPYDTLDIEPFRPLDWDYDPCLYEIKPIRDNGVIIAATSLIERIATVRPILGKYKPVWDKAYGLLRINLNERMKKNGK